MEKRLVVTSLKFVGADEKPIRIFLNFVGYVAARKPIQSAFTDFRATVLMLAGERNDGLVWAFALGKVALEGMEILDRPLNTAAHHHCSGLTTDLSGRDDLLVKVVDHDLGFEPNCMVMALDILPELLLCFLGVEFRIVVCFLDELVVAVDGGVRLQNVKDKTLFYSLLHRVGVEGTVFDLAFAIGRQRNAEHLQRLILGGRRKSEIAGILEHLARCHAFFQSFIDGIFGVGSIVIIIGK